MKALAGAALLALGMATGVFAAANPTTHVWGKLRFVPCTLTQPDGVNTVEARCGRWTVSENRADPAARRLSLAVAWIPAAHADPEPDPVFLLAGGPGQSARESYPALAPAFAGLLRKRHLVLLDQRGTGASHPLHCQASAADAPGEPGGDASADVAVAERQARECAQRLQAKADLRYYATGDAVRDLEDVRQALGVTQINLLGISYGTRVAQQYAARYPGQTRSLVLDGVVPNALVLGSEHARNLESALNLQLARCDREPACRQRFGNARLRLDQLMAQLRATPLPVQYRDPLSGEARTDWFGPNQLAGVVRMFAYAPSMAGMLPLMLHEAQAGRPEPLMAQSRMIASVMGEQMAQGMQLSVLCTEDAPELAADPSQEVSLLGNQLVRYLKAQCGVWPRGARAEGFRQPLRGDVPTLLLSGEFDPVTPPRYADQVLRGLTRARHLVARGAGHNVLPVGCMPRLVGNFIQSPDPAALQAQCLEELTYSAPFTGFYGWEP